MLDTYIAQQATYYSHSGAVVADSRRTA